MEIPQVMRKLDMIGWDFAGERTSAGLHGIHPYPAKFIPQIPRALIELFHPGDDSVILDPFCGSGTTLVEAIGTGIDSIGIDLNPLATLLSKVKTTPLTVPLAPLAHRVCKVARCRTAGKIQIPDIPRVDHWFKPEIQRALAALVAEINAVPDRDAADALRIALSSIIVRVSNQDSDTRYAAVEKKVEAENVWTGFQRAALSIGAALEDIQPGLMPAGRANVLTADITMVEPQQLGKDVGLVITSPPYPNAYEYWLYHKYRMYWLGMNPLAVREREIGARPHYFKKNHQTEEDFERQMSRTFCLLSKVMRRGCMACFVVGRSIIHGREIDNEALLARAGLSHGFRTVGSVQRTIAANRKSFNLSHGTINKEGIVVFEAGKS